MSQTTIAGVTNGVMDGAGSMVSGTADAFTGDLQAVLAHDLLQMTVLYQVVAIAVSLLVAMIAARGMNRVLAVLLKNVEGRSLWKRGLHFLLAVAQSMAFSVAAGIILSLVVWSLHAFGILPVDDKVVLVKVAYSFFYAWAILLALLSFSTELLGTSVMGPKMRRTVIWSFWGLVLLQVAGILPAAIAALKAVVLPMGGGHVTLWSIFVGAVTVFVTLSVANWLARIAESVLQNAKEFNPNLKVVIGRIIRVVFGATAILISMSAVGIDLTILSVFGGAVGVGLGFGLRNIAANYVSGFIILFDRSVKLGDLVTVDGFSGGVTQIKSRYAVVRDLAGVELIVPNENLVSSTVKNNSYTERGYTVTVDLFCGYEADLDKALAIMKDVVKSQPRVSTSREPWTVVTGNGTTWVDIRAGFWVDDPEKGLGGLKSRIIMETLKRFDEEGVPVPYPRYVVDVSGRVETAQDAARK